MTGYGLAAAQVDGGMLEVELSGVNARQFQFVFGAPAEFARFETQCREAVAARIARGRVTCRITWNADAGGVAVPDASAVAEYAARLKKLSGETGIVNDCGLAFVLNALKVREDVRLPFENDVLSDTLATALEGFAASRRREGAALAKDIVARVASLRGAHAQVAAFASEVPVRAKETLARRIAALGVDLPGDDAALAREVALIADKSDISEELTRLATHFDHIDAVLAASEPAGRKLDFICQEITRETNTIGMKAGDSRVSRSVVNLKAVLETIREQAGNIE